MTRRRIKYKSDLPAWFNVEDYSFLENPKTQPNECDLKIWVMLRVELIQFLRERNFLFTGSRKNLSIEELSDVIVRKWKFLIVSNTRLAPPGARGKTYTNEYRSNPDGSPSIDWHQYLQARFDTLAFVKLPFTPRFSDDLFKLMESRFDDLEVWEGISDHALQQCLVMGVGVKPLTLTWFDKVSKMVQENCKNPEKDDVYTEWEGFPFSLDKMLSGEKERDDYLCLELDLKHHSDRRILEEMERLLPTWREQLGLSETKPKEVNFLNRIIKYKLIAYLDLAIWAEDQNVDIESDLLSIALYPRTDREVSRTIKKYVKEIIEGDWLDQWQPVP